MTDTLAAYSLLLAYSAMAVYAIAFVMYVLDLSRRTGTAEAAAVARTPASTTAAAGARGGTALLERVGTITSRVAESQSRSVNKATRFQRTAFALTIVAAVVHLGAIVLRGLAADRGPWANMYEFSLTGTGIIVVVFVVINLWRDVKFLGAYITGFVVLLLGLAVTNFYVAVTPTPPPLQSYWLYIHISVAMLATGFYAVGGGLSIVQLLQSAREKGRLAKWRFLQTFPSSASLEVMASRLIIVGFAFWTFTLMAGAIWAYHAWGRYWGWDTKEVWTFIIWVVFAGYIHARATRGWRGTRSAWLAIIGLAAVLFNFTIVNLFFQGLHAYSGLTTS
ncbi:c-type cytochrome biogenesis protein CcsB [Pseudolysinimonas sp.]|uniref:c-type cytochrome biogenesis protein CcsB n=1 Tax=Pseudolysinimonas sp. TaxID=2680009 RepID=UPI003F802AE6